MAENQVDNTAEDDDEETIAVLQSFLEEHHIKDIRHILLQDDTSEHYSVEVNTLELFDSNNHVSQRVLAEPTKTMPLFDSALAQAAIAVMQNTETPTNMSFKSKLHVRLSNLPVCPELKRNTIPKSSDIGKFLAISGNYKMNDCGYMPGSQTRFRKKFRVRQSK